MWACGKAHKMTCPVSLLARPPVLTKEPDRKFDVPRHIAMMSQTIKDLIEALPDADEEIPLSNISGDEFTKVCPLAQKH